MEEDTENIPLIRRNSTLNNGLSLIFAIICIVDVFGVFPIVALPKTIINCGYYGIIVVISVCSIQIYTATLLGRCWLSAQEIDSGIAKKNRYPYSALAELTYGKRFSKFVTFLLDITIFGAGIPNLIVASQNLQLLGLRLTNNTFNLSFCYWIVVMGMILCPVLWLGSPKDMKLLCTLSVCLVFSVFILVWLIIIFDVETFEPAPQPDTQVPIWHRILSAYGVLSFQFDIHPTILTIQVDMKDNKKIGKAVLGGFIVSLGMFSLTCGAAAIRFGSGTHASLLETLPSSIFLHFAALLVALQLGLSSAVGNSALYQHMEDCMEISRDFNHKRCILRTTLTIVAILLAESVPRFDLVMSIIGGTLTGPLVFILPPLFFLKLLHIQKNTTSKEEIKHVRFDEMEENEAFEEINREKICERYTGRNLNLFYGSSTNIEVCFCVSIILTGICFTFATTYINVLNTIRFASFSQPCILNVTSATLFVTG